MTLDTRAQLGDQGPAGGSGPRELLAYRSAQGRWVLAAMIVGSSVTGIDSTVVVVALPAIGRNLHAGFGALQWAVTSYTLTLAALILLAGSLSDRWGRRRVFLAGLGWFTLASVLCAAAHSIGWLIAARAVQGVGGALMTPASLAVIEAAFAPGDRPRAIGTWAGFSGVSAAIAPFLGGWLLEAGSWRAIFLINVPVAAAAARATRRHVPESRDTPASGSADWPGALAGAAALAAITYAVLVLPGAGAGSPGFAALPPLTGLTGLTGAAYTDPARFRSSFARISWICAAAFGSAAVLAATLITGPGRPTPTRGQAPIQTPVPHLTCPVAFPNAPEQTRPDSSQASGRSFAADAPSPSRPG